MVRKSTLLFLTMNLWFSSCVQNSGTSGSNRRSSEIKKSLPSASTAGRDATASSASTPGLGATISPDNPLESILNDIKLEGEAELRHLIDPFDGTYKTKVTIPKNYKGFFYLSGINVSSLSNKVVKVRFKFGRELEPITLDATVGKAGGITPQTDIDLLIIDMNNQPFKDVRLIYDLYDYNDYRATTSSTTETVTPTADPRNSGLYCRGLKLEHDPTFLPTAANTTCNAAREKCLYSYAKVVDAGLFYNNGSGNVSLIPSKPQIDSSGSGYTTLAATSNLNKCLPDNNTKTSINAVYFPAVPAGGFLGGGTLINGDTVTIGGTLYTYRTPYRAISSSTWSISSGAIFGAIPTGPGASSTNYPTALFQYDYTSGGVFGAYHSFLFPRMGRTPLRNSIQYFGSSTPFNLLGTYFSRTLDSLVDSGTSGWMDGCNIRVMNYDSYSNEGISSCNLSATIELLYLDSEGREVEIPNTKTHKVKLQLIRPSMTNFEGKDVLFSAMKSCSSSNTCGFDECCFNNRCWSKSLVSICPEDSTAIGSYGIGQVCTSDFECSSMCCGASSSTCEVHINTSSESVFCSKRPGEQCIAKEWCRKENISKCYNVKTGFSPTGKQECALRCYNVPTHGDCLDGFCRSPLPPAVPAFDTANPDCSKAIDPPSIIK